MWTLNMQNTFYLHNENEMFIEKKEPKPIKEYVLDLLYSESVVRGLLLLIGGIQ